VKQTDLEKKGCERMLEITIKGDPKEIAALILALQERHDTLESATEVVKRVSENFYKGFSGVVKTFPILRKDAGYATQEALGKAIGVERVTIAKWDTGDRYPRPKMLVVVARALGVSEGDVIAAITESGAQRQKQRGKEDSESG